MKNRIMQKITTVMLFLATSVWFANLNGTKTSLDRKRKHQKIEAAEKPSSKKTNAIRVLQKFKEIKEDNFYKCGTCKYVFPIF